MLGKTLNAEAVAGITTVKNPIRLARMVIKKIRTCSVGQRKC
jgi:isoaspartyl peptidase/L-asparaginase-like protein (Ntn-hydrolase superfamily)